MIIYSLLILFNPTIEFSYYNLHNIYYVNIYFRLLFFFYNDYNNKNVSYLILY